VGVAVDAIDRAAVDQRLMTWAEERQSRVVCFVNVHSAILSTGDERHRMALAGADLAAPDGAPIAWTLRVKGRGGQPRVDGPGTMWRLCDLARARGVRVGLYGSTTQTLDMLSRRLRESLPGIDIGFVHSPPFRELSPQEDQAICDQVAQSGVGLLFVSLGCPKQEYWMATHRGRIPSVMLGVGAAFDFHAGVVARAPQWMGDAGLEWLHRLASQPGRLGRRYAYTNSLFMAKSLGEAMRSVVGRVRLTGPVRGRTRS
jgi:N-acetylglucosaminyldiphosphoundecaprenol N-acetyl-beta-D-mannosaminyltransferase